MYCFSNLIHWWYNSSKLQLCSWRLYSYNLYPLCLESMKVLFALMICSLKNTPKCCTWGVRSADSAVAETGRAVDRQDTVTLVHTSITRGWISDKMLEFCCCQITSTLTLFLLHVAGTHCFLCYFHRFSSAKAEKSLCGSCPLSSF